jgi:hypothetical protein
MDRPLYEQAGSLYYRKGFADVAQLVEQSIRKPPSLA